MSTFITKLDSSGNGPRLAVKDIIDVVGVPTTCGSKAVAEAAEPATDDAACLAGARAAGARIVGKANLHELAMLPIGTNPWFGTPVNPIDDSLIPGGSSSGSAVAVANGDADVALGSDTGGSIRVPSACCGTAGLKTTHGRIPVDGAGRKPARVVGRVRTTGHPDIETAIDKALHTAGFDVVTLDWNGMDIGSDAFAAIYFAEMWDVDHALVEAHPDGVGADIAQTVATAELFRAGVDDARHTLIEWRAQLAELFTRVELLALPTLPIFPPAIADINADTLLAAIIDITKHVALFNAAGNPCTAQPVPIPGNRVPASLELVGPLGGEELLLTTAQAVEESLAS